MLVKRGPAWFSGMARTLRLFVIARASRARIRLVRRRSRRKERLHSLLLTTAGARFPTLAIWPLFVIGRASRARIRLVRRRSRRKERLHSLLLTTAGARFPTLAIWLLCVIGRAIALTVPVFLARSIKPRPLALGRDQPVRA